MRTYTRSSPASIHIGKDAKLTLSKTKFSGALRVDIDNKDDAYCGSVWFENQEALNRFVEALKERVEA